MLKTGLPLQALTADNLMSREVLCIPKGMSLRDAAEVLARERISGAPVVDAAGRCVGVLSTTDLAHLARGVARPGRPSGPAGVYADGQLVERDFLPQEAVRWSMTADPVTASPDTPVTELARMMLDAHIHRVIVVDEAGRPTGIVTSTDVLAAVAYAEYAGRTAEMEGPVL
jgi:CBS domain-containing protein